VRIPVKTKTVYVAISSDFIHAGILNVLEKATSLGNVIVGALTDEVIATYKRVPLLDFATRKAVYANLKGVTEVVDQTSLSLRENLLRIRPDYVVHGDDWRSGLQSRVREETIEVLTQWSGELVEVPYTVGVSSTGLEQELRSFYGSPETRRGRLRKLLSLKPYIRVMEASNGLTGLIVEQARIDDVEAEMVREYDAMWVSSLCDSSFKGKPDIELGDFTSRINTINEIMEVTTKPIVLDGDTGGKTEHFAYNVKTLERMGVSAIIIEDKTGLKQNSLFGTSAAQLQEDPHAFASKIASGKRAQLTRDFMIFARIESLIAGAGVEDALQRAGIYLEEGKADGIMIHSKERSAEEIVAFMRQFREAYPAVPAILVPTSYNHLTEDELATLGANVIIYANHLLRSAYPAMWDTALRILEHKRSKEVDDVCMPISEVIRFIPSQ
jgi:phosphoenolpyruvate phosphomutase